MSSSAGQTSHMYERPMRRSGDDSNVMHARNRRNRSQLRR